MSGFIKICGLRDADAVATALAAGADALGFVFAPSVRRVTPEQARSLAAPARGRVPCVAVMLHPTAAEWTEVLQGFAPDVLQTDAEDFAALQLPASVSALPVYRDALRANPAPVRLLFEGPRSGTGQVADWRAAQALAQRSQLVLAGGLSPDNVAAAIAAVRPFGVDVSSGVEDSPGHKSPQRITDFILQARAAFSARPEERRA